MIVHGTFVSAPTPDAFRVDEDSYLLVRDGAVVGAYADRAQMPAEAAADELVDYGDRLVIPAFIDLHIHAPQYPQRGLGFDLELLPWLNTRTFPTERRFSDPAFSEKAYRAFVRKLWAVGTLRASVFGSLHGPATAQLMELLDRAGLACFAGKSNMDRNSPGCLVETCDESVESTEGLIRSAAGLRNVRYILTPRFSAATTPGLMEGLADLQRRYDLPVQSHLDENRGEVQWMRELFPECEDYASTYARYGLMPEGKTIMAHCVWMTSHEVELLRERDVMIAHCPQSNANLSSGLMPAALRRRQGLRFSIASDVGAGHVPDMNRHVAMAIEVSKLNWVEHPDEAPMAAPEAFWRATAGPGRFFARNGFGPCGAFEPGCEFDALVIARDELEEAYGLDPVGRLEQFVYARDDRAIEARWCRGRLLPEPFADDEAAA